MENALIVIQVILLLMMEDVTNKLLLLKIHKLLQILIVENSKVEYVLNVQLDISFPKLTLTANADNLILYAKKQILILVAA